MENKDIPTIYNRLNPDQEPYLQEDGAILAFEHLHGYRSADEVKSSMQPVQNIFPKTRRSSYLVQQLVQQIMQQQFIKNC